MVPVVAGVILHEGKVLIARRPPTGHLAGLWEFTGGKVERGEDRRAAISREIREELGIDVEITRELLVVEHAYPDRQVAITFFLCGLPEGTEAPGGETLRWLRPEELEERSFPPANAELIELLKGKDW